MALFLVTVAGLALTRSWWSASGPEGVLVEVRGDVPDPGLVSVSPPTAAAALRAVGADPAVLGDLPPSPLHQGDGLLVHEGRVRLVGVSDPVLVALPVDVNRATAEQLGAIPGVSARSAEAVVQDRTAHGPYRALEDLERVAGLGPGTVERMRPFSTVADVPPVDVNRATAGELESLPGIGPVLAARIVVDREDNGPYVVLDDLARVRGVSASTVAGLSSLAAVAP